MSSLSQVQVEQVEKISPHFNTDLLELLELSNGFTVVDKIGKFKVGERLCYVPVDMKYNGPNPEEYAFLDKGRVMGKKIRGIISCGLALKLEDQSLELSTDLSEQYHFVPYEAPEPHRPGASLGKGQEVKAPEIKPVQQYSVVDKINLYKQIQKLQNEAKQLAEICKDREVYCVFNGFSDDEVNHLKDVYEIYEQVQLETTMTKVLESPHKSRIVEDHKYIYDIGYEFYMQEAANGKLEMYKIKERNHLWGQSMYLVTLPSLRDEIFTEREITNWKREKE